MAPAFGNANKVAKEVKNVIEAYWERKYDSEEAAFKLKEITDNPDNYKRIKRGDTYTGVFKNIMGERRISEFEKLLNLAGNDKNER